MNFERFHTIEKEKEPSIEVIGSSQAPRQLKENPYFNDYHWAMADWEDKKLYLPDNSDEAMSFSVASHELGHLVEKDRLQPDKEDFEVTFKEELRAWEVGWKYLEKYIPDYNDDPKFIEDLKIIQEKIKDKFIDITVLTEPFYKISEMEAIQEQRALFLQTDEGKRIKSEIDGLESFVKNTAVQLNKESFLNKIDWNKFVVVIKKALVDIEAHNKLNQVSQAVEDKMVLHKRAGLKELFYNAKDPLAVLMQEMDNDLLKAAVEPSLLQAVKDKLSKLSFDDADDFASKIIEIAKPIWEITQKDKNDSLKPEDREMFTGEDLEKTAEIIRQSGSKKIYIVGNVGSGKTTFARELAAETDFKNIDLDHFFQIFRQENNNKEATLAELLQFVIAREQAPYIINHADLLRQDLTGDADCLVLLNPRIEEQLKSRKIRGANGAEGEWQNVGVKDYQKINENNLNNLESLPGKVAYKNNSSGTIVKLIEK